jgi:hypothetical protein
MMSGIKIGIRRSGNSVQISLQCHSEHHAIEAYDRLVEGAKGSVRPYARQHFGARLRIW